MAENPLGGKSPINLLLADVKNLGEN